MGSLLAIQEVVTSRHMVFVFRATIMLIALWSSILLALILLQLRRNSQAPAGIAWSGLQSAAAFPKLRACLREPFIGRKAIIEGYETFSRRGLPYILPGIPSNTIVLPPKDATWLASQADNVLSVDKLLEESFGLQYFLQGPGKPSVVDLSVLRRDLTKETVRLTEDVLDEVQSVFAEQLGAVSDGKVLHEVSISSLMQRVSARVSNRIFVGLPLSRNPAYERNISRWAKVCGISALTMRLFIPIPLRPVVMRAVAIPTQILHWWIARMVRPMIESRVEYLKGRIEPAYNMVTGNRGNNDVTQWMIAAHCRKTNQARLDPASLTRQITILNVGARGTLSTNVSLVLADILRYKDALDLIEEIREEAVRYFSLLENGASRSTLRNMVKLDSVIKETLRLNPTSGQGLMRKVVAAEGITTPNGIHLPCGAHVQTSVSCMQRDTHIFGPDANEYKPLRHYDRQTYQPLLGDQPKATAMKQRLATQVSADYLSFGLGHHACPGRFWAIHAMKLILAYLLAHYEIQTPPGWDPKYIEVGDKLVLSPATTITIRQICRC